MELTSHELANRMLRYKDSPIKAITKDGAFYIHAAIEIGGTLYLLTGKEALEKWGDALEGQPVILKNMIESIEHTLKRAKSYL